MLDTDGSSDGGAIEDGELSKDEILDLLNDESGDDPDSDKDDDKDKDDDSDEKDDDKDKLELKDDDDEDEDDKDDDDKDDNLDDDELIVPVKRKEILAKYPNLFKDFKYLETAYYRDREFVELFGTLDDAKDIIEKAEKLDTVEEQISKGDISDILGKIKSDNPNIFKSVVDNYLETLGKVDSDAQWHIISNVIKNTIIGMAREAKNTDNKQLLAAAQLVNQFVFVTSEFTGPTKLVLEDNSEKDSLRVEREELAQERYNTASKEISTKVNNKLRSTVNEHIDPKDSMSSFVKKHAIQEAMDSIGELISRDSGFERTMDSLWKKARDAKFSQTSMKKIRSVYLSKAKTLLPAVINRSRKEALRGSGKGSSDTGGKSQSPDSNRRRTGSRKSSSNDKRSDDGRGMSTYDFLNQ